MLRQILGKKLWMQGAVLCLTLVSANCSGKTYSTFFQPFDLVFGSQSTSNSSVNGNLIAATPLTNTRVMLTFSKPVTLSSGQTVSNYRITDPNGNLLQVLAASRDPNNANIIFLDTIPQAAGSQYTARVSGIVFVDGASLGNASATFTAPNNADLTGPQFSSVSVTAATASAATLEVFFNEAMDQTSAQTNTNYFVRVNTCGGATTNVATAVRDSSNYAKVTLTTSTALTVGQTYVVCGQTGLRDMWGNANTAEFPSAQFVYTAPTPRVSSAVSTSSTSLLVTFDQSMGTSGLTTTGNYTFTSCGALTNATGATITAANNNTQVVLTGLTAGTSGTCRVAVNTAVRSALGAPLTTNTNFAFFSYSNSAATDTTPPAIVGVTTTNSNTVVVTFSESVTGVTAGDFNFSPALNITGVSCTGNVCTLTTDDQSSTPYTLSVTNASGGIQDLATPANTLSSGSTTFTGDGKPYIVAIYPVDSGTVMVEWSEPIGNSASVGPADYSIAGATITAAALDPVGTDPSKFVKLTISPVLTGGTTYTLSVNNPTGSIDSSGNPTLGTVPNGGAFTGPSATTAPQVTSASSTSSTTVIVYFNEPLNNATIANTDFTLTGANCPTVVSAAPAPIQIAAGVVQLTVTATAPVAPATCTVTVNAGAVADLAGNTIAGTNNSATYQYSGTNVATPDTTAPTVASVVAFSNTEVRVYFSETVTTATGQNMANYAFSPAVTGGINNISCNGTVCTITLNAPGTSAVQYGLTVSGVQDAVPNTMATQTVNFSGIGSSVTQPTLFMATLVNSTTVELSFSEAMHLNRAQNTANYTVSGGNTVTAAVLQSDATKVRLTISPGAYGSSNSYTVTGNQGGGTCTPAATTPLTDLANNCLGTPNSATFSGSGTAPSTASLAAASDTGTVGDNITGVNLTSPGLQFTGSTTPNTTVVLYHSPTVAFTDAGDLVTLNSHGLANGTAVSFTTINATTGIVTNTTYYVINATANTFQLATTPGGAVVPLTTDGTGILNTPIPYATAVSNSSGNYTITVPSTATISQGTNQFNIATVGPTGLVSDLSQTFSITYDSTNPNQPTSLTLLAASDTGISNSDRITDASSLQFSVNCEAGATVVLRNGTTDITSPAGGATCPVGGNVTLTTTSLVGSGQTGTAYPNINVIQTDVAGNVSTASANLSVTVDSVAPGLTSSTLASNTTLTLNLNENAYTAAGGALTTAAFSLNFAANAGTATGASITGITHTAGSSTVTLTISVTGTVAGTETITVDTVANSVYDNAGNAASFSTGAKTLSAIGIANITNTPAYVAIAPVSGGTTGYIDLTWSEGVYTNAGATGSLVASDFSVAFVQNAGGNSTAAVVTCVTTAPSTVCPGTAPAAGATAMRLIVTNTGVTSGVETIQVTAATGEIHSGTNGITPNTVGTSVLTFPDRLGPTVTGVSSSTANGTYKAGDSVSIQVSFSENVTVTGTPQLTLSTGTPATTAVNYVSGSGTNSLTFTYTIAAGNNSADLDYASTGALTAGTSIQDAAGNNATLTLASPGAANSLGANKNIVVDGVAPTVTSVNSSTANGSYKAGDTISIQVNFSENVTVTGTPQLTLSTGTPATTAVNYVSGSGSNQLTFSYVIAASNSSADLDYASTGALGLNGGTITDSAGNGATLTLATPGAANSLGANKAIVVDTTAPTVTSVNSSTPNGTKKIGDTVSIQVNFSENVTVTGTPQLTLTTGSPATTAVNYVSGSGTSTLNFTYTVAAGNTSADLDYATTGSLGLNGGTIRDAALNDATLTLATPGAANSLGANKALVIDGVAPTVTNVTSATADGTKKVGDTVSIQITFSENVTVTGTPQLTLSTGSPATTAVNYVSGSGTSTLNFTYTVAAGNNSADLDYATTAALSAGTSIRDAAGNDATLTLASPGAANSLGANKALVIDGVAPTVSSVNSSTADGTKKAGDTVSIQVNFSENVTVTGTPQLTLATGSPATTAVNYVSGSGTSTLNFTYTVASGNNSADLDYATTGSLGLNGGTINDAAGNAATLTLATPGAANSLGANKALVIDGVAPTVSGVNSSTADGSYKAGDAISIQVTFSENVTVTGTPQLTLSTGTPATTAVNYVSGSGTNVLTFTYTIAASNSSADLDYASTGALSLNGGTITDAAGNSATLTLATPGAANSLGANKAIVVDTAVPTVSSVNSSTANGTKKIGDTVSIQVNFSENVTVTGTPQLTLSTGSPATTAVNYVSGSGTSTLNFTYTVAAGNTSADLDYATTGSLGLNGGTINDAAGNAATLTLASPGAANSLGANKALVIDGVAPTVTSVNSSTGNGSYKAGDVISIQVNFSENVTVIGTPQLTLSTGSPATTAVNYVSGSGTSSLTFTYTIVAGNNSADLDYASAAALSAGTSIRDAAGNDATLTLAAPGAAGSLGANKNLVVDTTVPTGYSVAIDQSYINNANKAAASFTFTGAEVGATYNYTFSSTGGGTNVSGSGTVSSAGQQITGINLTGLGDGTITLSVTLTDPAGNVGTAATNTKTKDVVVPVISSTSPVSSASVNSTLVSFTFSENCATGTVTWTRTGGAADSNHSQSLTGSELNSGAHTSIVLTNNPTLVDTSVYTISWNCTDAAGNTATTVSSTGVTYTSGPPTIVSAETLDTNNNGKIDTYRIAFNKNINDSTFPGYSANALGSVITSWLVAGYTNVRLIHGTAVTFATDTVNDSVLYVRFDENIQTCSAATQVGCDTDAKPDLTTTASPGLTDTGAGNLAQVTTGLVTEADGAKPILVAAKSLGATSADAIFSEPVETTTAQTAANYVISGGTNPSVSSATRDGTNTNIVHLVTGAQTGGQAYTLTVNTNVKDLANFNLNPSANTANFTGVTNPVVSNAVTASATTFTLTFNETVTAASTECANLTACASIFDNSTLPVLKAVSTGGAGVNSATYTITIAQMVEGQSYTVTVKQNTVTSVATGFKMTSTNNSFTFTGDGPPGAAISTDTATACPTNAAKRVVVQYDQAVTATATTATNYKITGCISGSSCSTGTGAPNANGAASVTSQGGNKYAVDFTNNFATDSTLYQLTISNVQDSTGNTINAPGNFSFQCGTDTTAPVLISATVVTATAGSTVILLTFSEGVDNVTANTATNYKYDTTAYGTNVLSAARQSNTAQVLVTFQPALANGGHQIRVQNVADLKTPTGNVIDSSGTSTTNVQPVIVNAPTGFTGGPIFTDPFGDGTTAGTIVVYDGKLYLGADTAASRLFEMNYSLTSAQTITLDADGTFGAPTNTFSGFLTKYSGCNTLTISNPPAGGEQCSTQVAINGIDTLYAACSGGTSTPTMTGTACASAGGTERMFIGALNTTGFYRSFWETTAKSSTSTTFPYTERYSGDTGGTAAYRSANIVLFKDQLFVNFGAEQGGGGRGGRVCVNPAGCTGADNSTYLSYTGLSSIQSLKRIGASTNNSLRNGSYNGGGAPYADASNGNRAYNAISVMYEHDNDGAGGNESQLYVANGGYTNSTLGSARTGNSDGGIMRTILSRSTKTSLPLDCPADTSGCSAYWEDVTPDGLSKWNSYISTPWPQNTAVTGSANCSTSVIEMDCTLPYNLFIPAFKAIPYMRTAPNGDLYMLRNACSTNSFNKNGVNGAGGFDFRTEKQVCPKGYEIPQLWMLPKNCGNAAACASAWSLVAEYGSTGKTIMASNTGSCGTSPNKCTRNTHATLLEFVGNYLYIGWDNATDGANVWRVDMTSIASGTKPAETAFSIVNLPGIETGSGGTNQKLFSHVTVNDAGKDWLIIITRDGSSAMKIYRTANDQN